MPGGIYLLDPEGELTEMTESAFAAEVDLQELLARHPNLLAGDQIDPLSPRRWILVSREVGVPDQEQGGARWALDHLFLDQDGVPTLVEVKRGSDPRIRREVVGQMLDYAANSVLYWTAETIRRWYEERCQRDGVDPEEGVGALLEGDALAVAEFWPRVKTNLQAGKVRLIFVADIVPPELRRIVEFLNQQMDPAEVLAVEIRQYAGTRLRTLVPRVLGQTSEALVRKSTGPRAKRQWDETSFFADLSKRRERGEVKAAQGLLDWARKKGCRIWWGQGMQDGSFFPMLDHRGETFWTISVWTYGRVEIQFQRFLRNPPFESESKRLELLGRLNAIEDISIQRDRITKFPNIPLKVFARPENLDRFLEVLDWLVGEIRAS